MEMIDLAKEIISNYGHPIFEGFLILLLSAACWRLFNQEKYLELIKFNLSLKDFGFFYELNKDEKSKALINENFNLKKENEVLTKNNSSNTFLLIIFLFLGLFVGHRSARSRKNNSKEKQSDKKNNSTDKDGQAQVNEIVDNLDFDNELNLKDLETIREKMQKDKVALKQ